MISLTSERWVLVGLSDPKAEKPIRQAISQAGLRVTRVQTVDECRDMVHRRTFLCAFFDHTFLRNLARQSCTLPSSTYIVLVSSLRYRSKALALQKGEKIHDWIIAPVLPDSVANSLSRAQIFLRMASELEFIKAEKLRSMENSMEILCSGSWRRKTQDWIQRFCNRETPLLLLGENGSGKQLLSRWIHSCSSRALSPLVSVDCRNHSDETLEKRIFGEMPPRSRISKSHPVRSLFSLAANGTLVFHRIEKMPRRFQLKLARVARDRTYSPIGGGDRLQLHARLIFTIEENKNKGTGLKTLQRDLARLLKSSTWRLPSLRSRKTDFSQISQKTLKQIQTEHGTKASRLTEGAMELAQSYSWPGNLRELKNVLWMASIISEGPRISLQTLQQFLGNGELSIVNEEKALEEILEDRLSSFFNRFDVKHLKNLHNMVLQRVERPLFSLVLQQTKGNQVRAAQLLGMNRNTLRKKLIEYQLR